jgi:hypothetical protein
MKKAYLLVGLLALGMIFITGTSLTESNDKVTICHIPPGNPGNAHSITISVNALPAHMAHGDSMGACEPECTLETDPECFCDLYPDHPECS